jgi:hypothetical protein
MASGPLSEAGGRARGVSPLGWLALGFLLGAEPVSAGQLLRSLRDRTLSCAVDAAFYVNATGTRLIAIGFGADTGTGVAEMTMSLAGTALQADQDSRFDLIVPGNGTTTRLRFQRTGMTGSETGGGVRLLVDADAIGDDCVVKRGRAAFEDTRFNTIRAGLCGNDPHDGCIAALEKGCGSTPVAECLRHVRPALDRINARERRQPH